MIIRCNISIINQLKV